ncbi:hypothetical protein GCM10009839_50000 [Catenulispora yoronensis]|uniref:Uncharacterized protein n=1 Tax=Catenulispora yoronensis TaxID=450799 RepID=A0ABN2UQE2_9ACTN
MITASPRAEILIAREVGDDQARRLVDLLSEFSVEAEVKRERGHRGAEELGWLVLLALPLHGFLSGLGEEAAKGFYARLCRTFGRGHGKHRSGTPVNASNASNAELEADDAPDKSLTLQDSVSGLRIELEFALPDEAFDQLAVLDLGIYGSARLRYDREAGLWRADSDPAAQ